MYQNPEGYERYMGRWSARLARPFLDFCRLDSAGRFLDVGCGTGSLSKAIRERVSDGAIVGLDPAWDYIALLTKETADQRTRFCIGDAQNLPFPDSSFDAALGLLMLQQIPDPRRAVSEMRRATRPGGKVGTAKWDFEAGMPMFSMFWDAVGAVDPAAAAKRSASKLRPTTDTSEESLANFWKSSGLQNVETTTIEVAQDFSDLEDYWAPFLSGATPTSAFAAGLPSETQEAIKAEVRRQVFADRPDGPFTLTARAFAVRGTVPAD